MIQVKAFINDDLFELEEDIPSEMYGKKYKFSTGRKILNSL